MNTLIIYLIFSGLIQLYRLLPDEQLGKINSKVPYFGKITIILSIILIVVGAALQIKSEIDKNKYSLFIVPKDRIISPGTEESFTLKIVNNKDYPIYQLNLKTEIEYGDLTVNKIDFKSEDPLKIESDLGGIKISWDVFGLVECGYKAVNRIIYDVDAHSTREFKINVNAKDIEQKSRIRFSITRTDIEPTKTIKFDPFDKCRRDNEDFDTYYSTGKMMTEHKRYNEAIFCFEKSIKINPKSACAHLNLGNAYHFSGNNDNATEEWKKSIEIDSKNPKPLLNMAIVLLEQKEYDEAIERLKQAAEIESPLKVDAYIMWGTCLGFKGENDHAIEKMNKALELNPKSASAYYHYGLVLKDLEKYEEAIEKFQKSSDLDQSFKLNSYGMWGVCLENLGRFDEAKAKYQQIIDIDPKSAAAKKSENSIAEIEFKIRNQNIEQKELKKTNNNKNLAVP